MIKNITIITLVLTFGMSTAQKRLNNYKYVVVPIQFEFLKGQDQYRTSSLTKHLFNQMGVKTYFDVQELPEELFEDRCKALYADVNKIKGGFLKTNIQIELKDCMGNIVETSQIGSTKEKSFKEAYSIAIREAFKSFEFMGYNYNSVEEEMKSPTITVNEEVIKNDKEKEAEIESLKQEIKELKEEKVVVEKPKPEIKVIKEPVPELEPEAEITKSSIDLLYAQKIEGGFQLVDSEPKKVMVLLNTAAENVFTVKGKEAIVFKKDGQWIYSENAGTTKTKKILNIKF